MIPGYQQTKMIRQTIYRLKRAYGMPLDIYCQTGENIDFDNGTKTVAKVEYSIRKAIMLPVNVLRQTLFTAGSVSSAKDFSYGGILELGDRIVVIDSRDLPAGSTFDLESTYAVVQGKRYEVKSITPLDYQTGFIFTLRELKGARTYQFVNMKVADKLQVNDAETRS